MKWAGLETPKCVTVHQRVNFLCELNAYVYFYVHIARGTTAGIIS